MPTPTLFLCPVCGAADDGLGPGPGGRPNATCRACSCLERHRFLAFLLAAMVTEEPPGLVVDIAPSRQVSHLIRAVGPSSYVSVDFDPDADGRIVDVVGSLTDLPLPAGSTSMLVCFQVLEHIPEDLRAMREVARVLRPDGIALLQVPWRPGPTDEDPDAPAEERIRRFGQADHVRMYGDEFVPRLQDSGLAVVEVRPRELLSDDVMTLTGIRPDEQVWFAATDAATLPTVDGLRADVARATGVLLARTAEASLAARADRDALVAARAQVAAARKETAKAKAAAVKWKKAYTDLRGAWPVRVMSRTKRLLGGRTAS